MLRTFGPITGSFSRLSSEQEKGKASYNTKQAPVAHGEGRTEDD